KRAYCLKTQPATGETYPKSDLFNKAVRSINLTAVYNAENILLIHRLLPGNKSKWPGKRRLAWHQKE
ncbi:hypothetical protein, partial [Enterobacter hormaechei]|uniref:hypothetical protein n=1 Tax=Enterobacter hormaechei TaxID=158836 RepID=UPI0023E3D883